MLAIAQLVTWLPAALADDGLQLGSVGDSLQLGPRSATACSSVLGRRRLDAWRGAPNGKAIDKILFFS